MSINKDLARQRGLDEVTINRIEELHKERNDINYSIRDEILAGNNSTARKLCKSLEEIEFQLQDLWGFPRDARYHKFWNVYGCSCPKMDNEERYPTGSYVINSKCVLHGSEK